MVCCVGAGLVHISRVTMCALLLHKRQGRGWRGWYNAHTCKASWYLGNKNEKSMLEDHLWSRILPFVLTFTQSVGFAVGEPWWHGSADTNYTRLAKVTQDMMGSWHQLWHRDAPVLRRSMYAECHFNPILPWHTAGWYCSTVHSLCWAQHTS